jgi:4-amino-4-deoxy-L-arabinose transferase-like glycosyltransferase
MVGVAITCCLAFCGFMKWLRNDRVLLVLLLATTVLAMVGILGRVPENPRLNTWDGLLGPFTYVSSYAFLRYMYKRYFHREPTYERSSWYDGEEGRRQYGFDVAVHVLPMMIAFALPVLLTKVLR